MKVFVTGAAGFIGAHVTSTLVAAGCEVLALVRPTSSLHRLYRVLDRIRIQQSDLANIEEWQGIVASWKPDACIHLAWYAEPGKYLEASENVAAMQNSILLLKALIAVKCNHALMVGTCAEYDTDIGFLREVSATRPTTLYAATKLALYTVARQLSADAGINFTWARFFYLYGPMEDKRRVIPALIHSLLRDEPFDTTGGEQVRDYLYIQDVAEALWLLIRLCQPGTYNIASGIPLRMRQLFETVGAALGKTHLIQFGALPYRKWEPEFICGDNRQLRALGWTPTVSMPEGISRTIDWCLNEAAH